MPLHAILTGWPAILYQVVHSRLNRTGLRTRWRRLRQSSKVGDAEQYILEEGEISFLYRPKPGKYRITTDADVAE